jgi:outer membrane receptor protein involved in Fe transport
MFASDRHSQHRDTPCGDIIMSSRRQFAVLAGLLLGWTGLASRAMHAQTTTGTIAGTVTVEQGQPIEDAQVQVLNPQTGFSRGVRTNSAGRYTVPGLEPGTYSVTVRRIGYTAQTRDGVLVTLGQTTRGDFNLVAQATVLTSVMAIVSRDPLISPTRTSVSTSVSDTALRRLPSLNRNFTDFVALTPQISTAGPGLSGGGTNNRYNSIQIDGANESDLFGLGSTGQPGGQASGKSIGIESVKEYQVLLAPFDVRQGNFAGALINAVTKSGTNEFHGSLIGATRNQGLTRSQPYINKSEQSQYGFSIGGPIIKDKAFFFLNPEWQVRKLPASGDYIGLPTTTLRQSTLDSVNALIQGYNLPVGGGGLATNENPLQNIFGRLDFNLPANNQLVVRHNYGYAQDDNFSRSPASFRLTNNLYKFKSTKNASVVQLRSLFGRGAYNELLLNRTSIRDRRAPAVTNTPQVNVIVPGYTIVSGSERSSQGNELDQDMFELTDNFTLPLGRHSVTIGSQNQFYKVRNLFGQNSYGFWTFGTVDSLRQGRPRTYQVGVPLSGDGAVRFQAAAYSAYAQDEWTVTPNFNLTYGLRVDVPVFKDKPPFSKSVLDSVGRNTTDIPSGNIEWSPRLGFNWNATGDDRNQVRGGVGLFSGRPAFVWLSNAFQNSGSTGYAQLTCAAAVAPVFSSANAATPPTSCTNGSTARAGGEIDLLDPNLKFPQNLRTTLGYDHRLAENWVGTVEGIYTRAVNGLFYRNLALAGIQGYDRYGRAIYGLTPGTPVRKHTDRDRVFDVTNQSKDHAYQMTVGLQRKYFDNYEGSVFYTYSRAFDVQSIANSTAISNIQFGRPWGGDLLAQDATRSSFEQRHRIVASGTYSFPTKTDLTVLYFGESGIPYDYTTNADINGEGFSGNDPLYIPLNALDPTEMVFQTQTYTNRSGVSQSYTPQQQADAFQRFIETTPCLRNNRGHIVPRNACESPWTHRVNVSGRQSLPTIMGQNVSLQVDVFNFLNLLNQRWGAQPTGGSFQLYNLLDYRGRTGSGSTPPSTLLNSQPIWSFNPNYKKFLTNNLSSNYQIQLQVRYSF